VPRHASRRRTHRRRRSRQVAGRNISNRNESVLLGGTEDESVPLLKSSKWVYLDDSGMQQGPFSTEEMRLWYADGMLAGDRKVKEANEEGEFIALSSISELKSPPAAAQPQPDPQPDPQPHPRRTLYSSSHGTTERKAGVDPTDITAVPPQKTDEYLDHKDMMVTSDSDEDDEGDLSDDEGERYNKAELEINRLDALAGVGMITKGMTLPHIPGVKRGCRLIITYYIRGNHLVSIRTRRRSVSKVHPTLASFDKEEYRPYLVIYVTGIAGDMGEVDRIFMYPSGEPPPEGWSDSDHKPVYGPLNIDIDILRKMSTTDLMKLAGYDIASQHRTHTTRSRSRRDRKLANASKDQLVRICSGVKGGLISVPLTSFAIEKSSFNTGTALLVPDDEGGLRVQDSPVKPNMLVKLNRDANYYDPHNIPKPPKSIWTTFRPEDLEEDFMIMSVNDAGEKEADLRRQKKDGTLSSDEISDIDARLTKIEQDRIDRNKVRVEKGLREETPLHAELRVKICDKGGGYWDVVNDTYLSWDKLLHHIKWGLQKQGYTKKTWGTGLTIYRKSIRPPLYPGVASDPEERGYFWQLISMAICGSTPTQEVAWESPHLPRFDMGNDVAYLDIMGSHCLNPSQQWEDFKGVSAISSFIDDFPEWYSMFLNDTVTGAKEEYETWKDFLDTKEIDLNEQIAELKSWSETAIAEINKAATNRISLVEKQALERIEKTRMINTIERTRRADVRGITTYYDDDLRKLQERGDTAIEKLQGQINVAGQQIKATKVAQDHLDAAGAVFIDSRTRKRSADDQPGPTEPQYRRIGGYRPHKKTRRKRTKRKNPRRKRTTHKKKTQRLK
jgi:hypothetical protein